MRRRIPHRKRRPRSRPPPQKDGSPAYRQLWRLVDGEVRAMFLAHPDYLPEKQQEKTIRISINKRVVGKILSWAAERSGQGRSHGDGRPTPDGGVSTRPSADGH